MGTAHGRCHGVGWPDHDQRTGGTTQLKSCGRDWRTGRLWYTGSHWLVQLGSERAVWLGWSHGWARRRDDAGGVARCRPAEITYRGSARATRAHIISRASCCCPPLIPFLEAGPATGCAKARFVAGSKCSFLHVGDLARIAHAAGWSVGSGARPPERLRGSAGRVPRGPFRLAPGRRRPGEMG